MILGIGFMQLAYLAQPVNGGSAVIWNVLAVINFAAAAFFYVRNSLNS